MATTTNDDAIMRRIAANVARLRGKRSRYWLGKQVGATTIQITRIETGCNLPRAGLLARLAEVLGTTVDSLISEAGGRKSVNSRNCS